MITPHPRKFRQKKCSCYWKKHNTQNKNGVALYVDRPFGYTISELPPLNAMTKRLFGDPTLEKQTLSWLEKKHQEVRLMLVLLRDCPCSLLIAMAKLSFIGN